MVDNEDPRLHKRVKMDYSQCCEDDGPADYKLICDGQMLLVHKARLRKSSEFFEQAFSVRMKESRTGEMVIQEKDFRVVGAAIYWMYFDIYDDGFSNDPSAATSREIFNAKVYALAEEWKIALLKKFAVIRTKTHLMMTRPGNTFVETLEVVYGSTPSEDRVLRDVYAGHAARFHRELLKTDAALLERLERVVGFGMDLVKCMSDLYVKYQCCFSGLGCDFVFEWPVHEFETLVLPKLWKGTHSVRIEVNGSAMQCVRPSGVELAQAWEKLVRNSVVEIMKL